MNEEIIRQYGDCYRAPERCRIFPRKWVGALTHIFPMRICISLLLLLTITSLAQDSAERRLQDAAFDGNLGEVKRLLAAGANIDARKEPGAAPLYNATLNQHEGIALFLIRHRAALNGRGGPKHDTALMNAASFNELSVIRALLQRGARADLRDDLGWTALKQAVFSRHLDAAKLLRQSQAK